MIIETNPCEKCEFIPSMCDGDIEIYQMRKGNASPISNEEYEHKKTEQYMRIYSHSWKAEVRSKITAR